MPVNKLAFRKFAFGAATDGLIIASLPQAQQPYFRDAIATQLASRWHDVQPAARPQEGRIDLFSEFIKWTCHQWATNPDAENLQPLFIALKNFQTARLHARVARRILVEQLRLNSSSAARLEFISQLPMIALTRLAKPYPPKGFWWYETGRALKRWEAALVEGKQADKRKKRFPLLKINSELLQCTISSCSDAVIRDRNTGELVLMVVRNFCRDLGVLNWVDGIVREVIGHKRSVRLEDPGKLTLVGYSAGALSAPKFDWVRNLLSPKQSAGAIEELDANSTAVFALFWNMLQSTVPDEVREDFEDFLQRADIVRMGGNPASPTISRTGSYSIIGGAGDTFTFSTAPLAPPQGVFAENYSRAGHFEHQPHKYAASWTTGRIGPASKGGLFYVSSHGICVEPAANTMVVWQPLGVHGTSLQDRLIDQHDPHFSQTGLAIVTSNRLPSIWKRYRKDLLTHKEAAEDLEFDGSNEDDNVDGEGAGCCIGKECPICLHEASLSDSNE